MTMLKELIKKQKNKSLKIFYTKTYGNEHKNIRVSSEKCADIISERMTDALKQNLSQQGLGVMAGEVVK